MFEFILNKSRKNVNQKSDFFIFKLKQNWFLNSTYHFKVFLNPSF